MCCVVKVLKNFASKSKIMTCAKSCCLCPSKVQSLKVKEARDGTAVENVSQWRSASRRLETGRPDSLASVGRRMKSTKEAADGRANRYVSPGNGNPKGKRSGISSTVACARRGNCPASRTSLFIPRDKTATATNLTARTRGVQRGDNVVR